MNLNKKRLMLTGILTIVVLIYLFFFNVKSNRATINNNDMSNKQLIERLKRLEPLNPRDIKENNFYPPLPLQVESISNILITGKKINYQVLFNDPNWVRPTYRSYWNSSVSGGR